MRAFARPLGVLALCIWTIGMLLEAIARALFFSIRQVPSQEWTLSLTWPVLAFGAGWAIFLLTTIIGLWLLKTWGRRLLLVAITVHYGSLLVGSVPVWGPLVGISLWAPGQGWVSTVVLEAVLGLGFGWWYLRRSTVRSWFTGDSRPTVASIDAGPTAPQDDVSDV